MLRGRMASCVSPPCAGYLLFMSEGLVSAILFRHMGPGPERLRAIWAHALMQVRRGATLRTREGRCAI